MSRSRTSRFTSLLALPMAFSAFPAASRTAPFTACEPLAVALPTFFWTLPAASLAAPLTCCLFIAIPLEEVSDQLGRLVRRPYRVLETPRVAVSRRQTAVLLWVRSYRC